LPLLKGLEHNPRDLGGRPIEFNDVRLQYENLSDEINAAIGGVLASGRYILGPVVEAFEEEFARYCKCASGIGVASGTDALRIALTAAGVRPGDEVLVPAVSAAATAMAVTQLRAVPVFVDIDPEDFTMSPADAMEKKSSRTKAAIPVHLYGMPARLKELSALRVPLIEDAAQAHGSEASWGRCGSFGVAAAFSFYPTKNLGTYGDGGMIVTSNTDVARLSRLLRNYGQRENYAAEILGDNSRLDELHAAILRVKLKRLDSSNRRRREIAASYRAAFAEIPLAMQKETGKSNYHLFVVATSEREALRQHLLSHDVPTAVHYPTPLHRQKAFESLRQSARSSHCLHAEQLCARVLSLPMHAHLAPHDVDRVISAVRSFFSSRHTAPRRNED
jgi:dTDP-4-amino-4,6-dideoxygalactose transaminase